MSIEEARAAMQAQREAYAAAITLWEGLADDVRAAIRQDVTSDLEADGWHADDECHPCERDHDDDQPEEERIDYTVGEINGSLIDWHDREHGLTHYPFCTREPCALIRPDLRNMPALHLTR